MREAADPASRGRSRVALGLTAAAARGRFELQVCAECGAVQYPPREACHRCLSGQLSWQPQSGLGELLCETTLYHSNDERFREHLPLRIGIVHLDCDAILITYLHGAVSAAPCRVRVSALLDKARQAVLVAFPEEHVPPEAGPDMTHDRLAAVVCVPVPVGREPPDAPGERP
jgi:uncharacterized OB-fold protein